MKKTKIFVAMMVVLFLGTAVSSVALAQGLKGLRGSVQGATMTLAKAKTAAVKEVPVKDKAAEPEMKDTSAESDMKDEMAGDMMKRWPGKRGMKGKPMMAGMMMKAMMQRTVVATSDGGVVVSIGKKMVKYDQDMNLVKEVEIPVDMAELKKDMMDMVKNCPMMKAQMGDSGSAEEDPGAGDGDDDEGAPSEKE